MAICLFLSALLMLAVSVVNKVTARSRYSTPLLIATSVYSIFCFVTYGRIAGFIPSVPIHELISQTGFDLKRMPLPIEELVEHACMLITIFNLLTAIWIYKRWNFWWWVICSVIGFCIVCTSAGPFIGLSPIVSLFSGCCIFMLLTGWALGLTYVQFCVIGNIWVPIVAIISSAGLMMFTLLSNPKTTVSIKTLATLYGGGQIVASAMLALHYALPFREAFFLCVDDLKAIALTFNTTYVIVNIAIYVVGIVAFLAINICLILKYNVFHHR